MMGAWLEAAVTLVFWAIVGTLFVGTLAFIGVGAWETGRKFGRWLRGL